MSALSPRMTPAGAGDSSSARAARVALTPSSVTHSFANLTSCVLQLSPEAPALDSFGRSDAVDSEDVVRKKGGVTLGYLRDGVVQRQSVSWGCCHRVLDLSALGTSPG